MRGGAAAAERVQGATCRWVVATSLGGVESLLERGRRQPTDPVMVRELLVRLSVGVEDLWSDPRQRLDSVR